MYHSDQKQAVYFSHNEILWLSMSFAKFECGRRDKRVGNFGQSVTRSVKINVSKAWKWFDCRPLCSREQAGAEGRLS